MGYQVDLSSHLNRNNFFLHKNIWAYARTSLARLSTDRREGRSVCLFVDLIEFPVQPKQTQKTGFFFYQKLVRKRRPLLSWQLIPRFFIDDDSSSGESSKASSSTSFFLSLKIISKLFFISKMSPVLLAFIRMIACQLWNVTGSPCYKTLIIN